MPDKLEARFHEAMMDLYRRAKAECSYNAVRFLSMVVEHGGLEAASRLINATELSDGFVKLCELERLDLAVECYALKPEFRPLFTDDELAVCKKRLLDARYDGPEVQ